ncbi:MAG: AAA family ATPase, partial [Candidatus Paceibacterota bacterium]
MVTIQMPLSDGVGMDSYELEGNLVIVGSNGSGKSRFGAAIEQNNPKTKRISAQRYLQMEERVQPQDYETAINTLAGSHKNQAPITPQNDFQQVLVSLFAEQARRNEDAVKKLQEDGTLTNKQLPSSVKDKVIEVWNFVFPHRPITLEKERVSGIGTNGRPFAGTQMSDGEKVGLYLIAQVLLAENSSILIIDEPELHLHKALMVRLWNKLEEYRSDCTFVYITHDLDFAVGKLSTKTIWIKTFVLETTVWFW